MPLADVPVERTFADLVDEGRALIPRLAPAWTDHNVHDPGITLLELFAWITEADLYRASRSSDAAYRSFLRFLSTDLRAASAAVTPVVFSLARAAAPLTLPAGMQIADAKGRHVFQTTEAVRLSPASIVTLNGHRYAGEFAPFEGDSAIGSAFYLGFDQPLSDRISLYVWTTSSASDRATQDRLRAEWEARSADAHQGLAGEPPDWRVHYSVRTVWEYHSASGWRPLADVMDETRALTLSGRVHFAVPGAHAPGGREGALWYVRCRIAGGHFDCPPMLARIALNVVPAWHASDVTAERIGKSDGTAGQTFTARRTPVLPGTTRLSVSGSQPAALPWREELRWDRVGAAHPAYVLDPESGEIAFGDGQVGEVPPAGAELALSYAVGGGPAGNVPAGTLTHLLADGSNAARMTNWNAVRSVVAVHQPYAASGGANAESPADAKARAVRNLATPSRAITLDDCEVLARSTPGVPVGRAHAIAETHPALHCYPASGSVTVVVVPSCADSQPLPGPDMLKAVACYLEPRRPVATELHVAPPRYTTVAVHARVHVARAADAAGVRERAQAALDAFFDPLRGGSAHTGWPVGRDVYRSEILALLNGIDGVLFVDEVGLRVDDEADPRCGNVPLCPDSLVAAGDHRISVIQGRAGR